MREVGIEQLATRSNLLTSCPKTRFKVELIALMMECFQLKRKMKMMRCKWTKEEIASLQEKDMLSLTLLLRM